MNCLSYAASVQLEKRPDLVYAWSIETVRKCPGRQSVRIEQFIVARGLGRTCERLWFASVFAFHLECTFLIT